jgi:hypothetical protein
MSGAYRANALSIYACGRDFRYDEALLAETSVNVRGAAKLGQWGGEQPVQPDFSLLLHCNITDKQPLVNA